MPPPFEWSRLARLTQARLPAMTVFVSADPGKKIAFTPEEIRAFRYLAIILAAITAAIGVLSHSAAAQIIAIVMAATIMVAAPFAVHISRRGRRKE
jgi:hypothetical protein